MDGVDKSGGEGAGNGTQGFGGVVEAHDQILLGRVCVARHHILQHRQTHGVTGVDQNGEGNEDAEDMDFIIQYALFDKIIFG